MVDCGHEHGCDCDRGIWNRESTSPRLSQRRTPGRLDVCPDCHGAGLHKSVCPRRLA